MHACECDAYATDNKLKNINFKTDHQRVYIFFFKNLTKCIIIHCKIDLSKQIQCVDRHCVDQYSQIPLEIAKNHAQHSGETNS